MIITKVISHEERRHEDRRHEERRHEERRYEDVMKKDVTKKDVTIKDVGEIFNEKRRHEKRRQEERRHEERCKTIFLFKKGAYLRKKNLKINATYPNTVRISSLFLYKTKSINYH